MNDFELSPLEKASHLWVRLREHLEERLADARRRNDRLMSETETAAVRGEIQLLKKIIALGNDRPMTGDYEQPP